MSSIWGGRLRISLFGESHGNGVGVVVDSFPAGYRIDNGYIEAYMRRRAPGLMLGTARSEPDQVKIFSGVKDGYTTGAPICAFIENTNVKSGDYGETLRVPRPSHADYAAYLKYGGFADHRGGGHFSARLTAGLVFAGALCLSYLSRYGVHAAAHLRQVGKVADRRFDFAGVDKKLLKTLFSSDFPVLDTYRGEEMRQQIEEVRRKGDSVGGIVECAVCGLPSGLGAHMFDSAEASLSSVLWGIPGVKGIEFGSGFEFGEMYGSEANDLYEYATQGNTLDPVKGEVYTKTNHCGGIQGGMTYGMPMIFSVAFKPTPSIFIEQDSIDVGEMKNIKYQIKGRHDPCIALRAVPVVEAAAGVAALDMIMRHRPDQLENDVN